MIELTESQGLQLQIQTVQFTPATITFNADQIGSILDQQLVKYQGLTFTEDTEAEAKKVIAELRKGKALLETYRKTTKAELTVSVTEFEQQIKELASKFDAVILPLTEQTDRFEKDRVEKKQAEVEKIIASLVVKFQLQGSFAEQLIAPESYLNRTATMSSINSELLMEAKSLKVDQDRTESELALIRSNVELANFSLSGAGLLESTYTRLLGSLTLVEVLSRLNADVAAMKDREEKAAARAAEVAQTNVDAVVQQHTLVGFTQYTDDSTRHDPQYDASQPSNIITKHYRVTGTAEEHEQLEAFLSDRIYDWEVY